MSDSRPYTVQKGESIQDIATREYGVPAEYPRIYNSNPQLGNEVLDVQPGQVIKITPIPKLNNEIEIDNLTDDSEIIIDNTKFNTVWALKIETSLDMAADQFSFQLPWDPDDFDLRELFRPFSYKRIEIRVGGVLQLTGTIINIKPVKTTNKSVLQISGYSLCGVLNDCMYPANKEATFLNSTFFEICRTLAEPFNISVDDKVGDEYTFDEVKIKKTDKVYKFMAEIAKKRGVLITSLPDGNLVIQKTTEEESQFTFKEGKPNILKISGDYKGQDGFTHFTGILEAQDVDEKIESDSRTVVDDFISDTANIRPFVFEVADINSGAIEQATIAKMRRSWARRISYKLTVNGWRDPSNSLWHDNQLIKVFYPSVMIYNTTEFLISKMERTIDDSKKITMLTLVMPHSYNDKDLDGVPWE